MKITTILATFATATAVVAQNPNTMNGKEKFQQPFPQGAENPPVNAQYFIG